MTPSKQERSSTSRKVPKKTFIQVSYPTPGHTPHTVTISTDKSPTLDRSSCGGWLHIARKRLCQDVRFQMLPTIGWSQLLFDDDVEQMCGDVITRRIAPLEQHLGLFAVGKHCRASVPEGDVQAVAPCSPPAARRQREFRVGVIRKERPPGIGSWELGSKCMVAHERTPCCGAIVSSPVVHEDMGACEKQ